MSISDRLPREIQIKIFNYFGIVDLLECQLTCKRWNECSARALYKNTKFHSFNLNRADEFMKALIRRRYLKDYIQHIKVTCYDNYVEQSRDLLMFFANECPNVQTATLSGRIDTFYPKNLHHEKWKFLEEFHTDYSDQPNLAIGIAKQHQETMKEIKLNESDIPILCDNKQDIKEKLAEFRSLEKISITIKHSRHLSSFDNMIPKNIKSLTLVSDSFRNEQNTTDPQYIDLREITPCPNIKELILRTPLNNENSFKYLMHKFPKLEKLSYKSEEIISVSEDTREAITGYLLNIKNINVMYTLVCNSDSPMDYFFIKKLIESSKTKESKKKCNFTVSFSIYNSFINKVQVDKKTNNGVESYEILVGLEELQKLDFLKSFGTDLTGLEVRKFGGDGLDLNEIFKQCPNLRGLTIREFDAILSEEVKENTMSLKSLKYFGSERFTPEILAKWSTHFPNLTELTFSGSKDTVTDFSSIIAAFSNLKSLEIYNAELFLSNPDKKSYTVKKLSLNNCRLPTDGHSSNLFRCLPNVYDLKLRISDSDLKAGTFILDMPEASIQGLSMSLALSRTHSISKSSLLVDNKIDNGNKRYYLSGEMSLLRCMDTLKSCTETDYKSAISSSRVIQIVANCKGFPMLMQLLTFRSGVKFISGSYLDDDMR